MGYKFQFITLAGFHSLNYGMFALANDLQGPPDGGLCGAAAGGVRRREPGYSATRHQREVGTGYFDAVTQAIANGQSSLAALTGSTEEAQFKAAG